MDRVINHDLEDAKLCRKSGCSKPCIYWNLLIIIFIINNKYLLLQVKEDSYMSKLLWRFLSRGRSIWNWRRHKSKTYSIQNSKMDRCDEKTWREIQHHWDSSSPF